MTAHTVTRNQLESHLWEAANIWVQHMLRSMAPRTGRAQNELLPEHVEPKVEQDVLTVEEAMQRLQASATAAFAAEDKLMVLLKREGLLQ